MELSSRPKPVRIRISIGGKEHTAIDSLKENMTPEILDFIDGRLQRWLKQQALDDLSAFIDGIYEAEIKSGQKLLRIYNCFFGKEHKRILKFVDEWQKDIRSKSLMKYYFENKDNETLVSVSLPDTIKKYLRLFSLEDWLEIVPTQNLKTLEKILYEEFPKSVSEGESSDAMGITIFDSISNDVKCEIVKHWNLGSYIQLFTKTNKIEEDVYEFIKKCSSIFNSGNTKVAVERTFALSDYSFQYFLINEIRCIRVLATLYQLAKRYDSEYLLRLNRQEADEHLRYIPEDYRFKQKIKHCNKQENCLKIVSEIIHYLLLERRFLPDE